MEMQNMNEELNELVRNVWQEFVELRKNDDAHKVTIKKREFTKKISDIVLPTMPILYFGNYNAYKNSNIKIVTVSLNPSDMEFKKDKNENEYSFFRFSEASDLYGKDSLNDEDVEKYITQTSHIPPPVNTDKIQLNQQ